ncbi:MAG: polysaccharide deacetylase family protein [Lachnospiraceae bacterium]
MSDKSENTLKQTHDRRKRVNRIKNSIVVIIGVWMIISMILCVTLFVRVLKLEHTLKELVGNLPQVEQVDNIVKQNSPQGDTKEEYNTNAQQQEEAEADQSTDNLAEEGEQLKVYLTFDDGPSKNTERILDILDEYGVKATFFVTGKTDEESQALYKRIVEEGHTLGMHSYSHKYSAIYESREAFEADFNQLHDYLYQVTGVDCKYYRFPGGSSNKVSNLDMREFISYLNQQGVTYFDWNVSSGDATSQAYTTDELIQNVMGDVTKYKTSVVLLHDATSKTTTVDSLAALIEQLQSAGAEILPIDEDTTPIQHVRIDDNAQ